MCAAGGETEEERIRVDILENQAMDTRIQLAMVCYSPDFVSWSWPHTLALASALALFATRRSEERRVGKECKA